MRSTHFDRYQPAHRLLQHAIKLQGEKAIDEGVADAKDVAVDKNLIAARGPFIDSLTDFPRRSDGPRMPTTFRMPHLVLPNL